MLVLKVPKTKTSVRKVFLPKAVAEMLVERKKMVDELKELLGDEYRDYDLVFASTQGTPTESNFVDRAFSKLIADNHLPKVVFHSLRHTSTTYKLKLSGGETLRPCRAIPVMRRLQWSRSGMPTFWTMTAGSTPQDFRRSFMAVVNRRQRQARYPKYGRLPPIRCKVLMQRPNSSCF